LCIIARFPGGLAPPHRVLSACGSIDAKARLRDALAAASGAAAGGLETAGGAVLEREAAGGAAGGLDAQTDGAAAQAAFDVAEIILDNQRREIELPPELLEGELAAGEEIDDPLPGGLCGGRITAGGFAPRAQ
jgi:hypothetical protein